MLNLQDGVNFTFLALAHADVPEDTPWLQALSHRCDMTVGVEPMEGRVADIDGRVRVTFRDHEAAFGGYGGSATPSVPLLAHRDGDPRGSVLFRAGDSSVRWISQMTGRELM